MTIRKLREAVEAGIATGGPADALVVPKEMGDLIASVLGDDDELWSDFVEAHDGSLDAAKRLHDALLPGWIVKCMCQLLEVGKNGEYTGGTDGWLVNLRHLPDGHSENSAIAETPARAWLLAILRAMEGKEGGE